MKTFSEVEPSIVEDIEWYFVQANTGKLALEVARRANRDDIDRDEIAYHKDVLETNLHIAHALLKVLVAFYGNRADVPLVNEYERISGTTFDHIYEIPF